MVETVSTYQIPVNFYETTQSNIPEGFKCFYLRAPSHGTLQLLLMKVTILSFKCQDSAQKHNLSWYQGSSEPVAPRIYLFVLSKTNAL
jgi:hypothetical protein